YSPIVGAKVVPPIRNAMRFVDYEEADAAANKLEHVSEKPLIAQTFGRDKKNVAPIPLQRALDRVPLRGVIAVDYCGIQAEAARHVELISHQRSERAYEQRR